MTEEFYIISKDETKIGYRQTGKGPGLIIVHGSGRISQNYQKLALELSNYYCVYVYDRRGRGLSRASGQGHGLQKEIEDLLELIKVTKAEYIFGHSFGGLITLQTLIKNEAENSSVKKIAVYDPGVSIHGSIPTDWLLEFEQALSQNKKEKAMVLLLKGLKTPHVSNFPGWILSVLVRFIKFLERKKEPEIKMLNLLSTIPNDIKIIKEPEGSFKNYKSILIPVLLMSGNKSQSFFINAVNELTELIPKSEKRIIDNFDHYSPEEKTEEISILLHGFFR